MRTITGAILILAAAVLRATAVAANIAFLAILRAYGGNPIYIDADIVAGLSYAVGGVGVVFLVWGAITDRRKPGDTLR
jgi:hypothetical protein